MSLCVQKGNPHSPLYAVEFVSLHIIVADQANLTNTVACDNGFCHGGGVGCWFNQLGYWLTMMVFVAVSYSSQISIYDGRQGCGGHDKTIVVLSEGPSIGHGGHA